MDPKDLDDRSGLVWNLRETNLFNSRVIVSRKRTRNFMDLTNLWKKSVLGVFERDVLADLMHDVQEVVGPRGTQNPEGSQHIDDEEINIHRRSPSPRTGEAWTTGSASTWGRGARPGLDLVLEGTRTSPKIAERSSILGYVSPLKPHGLRIGNRTSRHRASQVAESSGTSTFWGIELIRPLRGFLLAARR
ncbi:hypothetical protein V8E53_004710 [Lactarius tabidus]